MPNYHSTIVKIIANNVMFNWFDPYKTDGESESIGTGFFIDNKGYIVTCAHVVIDAIKLWITIPSKGKDRFETDIIAICDDSDLALLRVKDYKNDDYLELGDSDKVKPGARLLADFS